MNKQVLVTGVNGFVGQHVARELRERDIEVMGVGNQPKLGSDVAGYVNTYTSCDLTDPAEVAGITLSGVSAIINLAGFANVGDSKGQGELYNKVNIGVHTVLYEECIRQGVNPRVIAVSTGAVYDTSAAMPIAESSPLLDDTKCNEYSLSKKLMEKAVAGITARGLRCIITRPFNHTGPGQQPGFLLPDLYQQILDSLDTGRPLMTGNLETKRDFTDVRDVARAYVELATCDQDSLLHDVYNICSGRSVAGKDILDLLERSMGVAKLKTQVDQGKIRENEIMDIYGSAQHLTIDTGWSPTIPIEQTIRDFVTWKNPQ